MGNSCRSSKKPTKEREPHNPPEPHFRRILDINQPKLQEACIGPFLTDPRKTIKPQLRLEKWNKMYNMYKHTADPLYNYARDPQRSNKYKRRVCKGPPAIYRWSAWCAALNLKSRINVTEYHNLSYPKEEILAVIQRDLNRTFPEHSYFDLNKYGEIGQESMKRILSKFATKHPDIEYCQGMNFVAGFLLLISGGNEIESFYMLELFCNKYSMRGFYIENMPELKKCIFVFNCLFKKFLPKLFKHFEDTEVPSDLWISKWIMTLFTMTLSFETIVRVWDLLIIKGPKIVYQVALALLFYLSDELLELDLASIANLLRLIKNFSPDPEELIKKTMKFKVKTKKLSKLKKLYEDTTASNSPASISQLYSQPPKFSQTKVQRSVNQPPAQTQLTEEIPRINIKKLSRHSSYSGSKSNYKDVSKTILMKTNTIKDENIYEESELLSERSETIDARELLKSLLIDSNSCRPSPKKKTHKRSKAVGNRENIDRN